jgi:hypothetical protein
MVKNTILRILTFLLFGSIILAEGGKISGIVVEKDSGEPLLGVSIIVEGQGIGADSDVNGQFIIINVRPGTYTLKTSYIGYATVKVTDLIVNIGRTSKQDFALTQEVIEGKTWQEILWNGKNDQKKTSPGWNLFLQNPEWTTIIQHKMVLIK